MALATLALAFVSAAMAQQFPKEWGEPPMIGTMDYRVLPGGYGYGGSTLASWIESKMGENALVFPPAFGEPPLVQTRDFRPLPFGYGFGSGTMGQWLKKKAVEVCGENYEADYIAWYQPTVEDGNDR